MLLNLPDDVQQGAIYRIIFFHVPAAWTSLLLCFVALGFAVGYLRSKNLKYDSISAAAMEVALVFGLTNIFTGMIWGQIIWGTAWTWDARLTTMFLLMLIYAGYLLLRQAIAEPAQRARNSAFMVAFAAIDVPIIWFSIKWWRTQHPQPVFWDKGSIDPAMANMNYMNWLPILMLAAALIIIRGKQLEAQREVDGLRRLAFSY
jgi:heme exporter protein C